MSFAWPGTGNKGGAVFRVLLIKPSHYDDDGYVIQWARTDMPSNSLAVLYGLASDCAERRVLGADVEIRIEVADETNRSIKIRNILLEFMQAHAGQLVDLVCQL